MELSIFTGSWVKLSNKDGMLTYLFNILCIAIYPITSKRTPFKKVKCKFSNPYISSICTESLHVELSRLIFNLHML